MILSWRKNKLGLLSKLKKEVPGVDSGAEIEIPSHFLCPISLDLMKDPVILCTGITYDRESIEKWIDAGNFLCPVTKQGLTGFDLIPNHALRRMIQDWCVANRSYGIERIPTPRIPVTPYEVSEICSRIAAATQRTDSKRCGELVGKIRNWGRESERNRRCIVSGGTGNVLAASFEHFAGVSIEKHAGLLEEILLVLVWMFPIAMEGLSKLGSADSLKCLVSFLVGKDLSPKKSAVFVLKELLLVDQRFVDSLAAIEGVPEALVSIVKEPLCSSATRSSLTAIFYMILPSEISEKMALKFMELGLVSLLLEFLVDAEKSLCEKALGILDGICDFKQGREKLYQNALTIPLLVKKILRVSELSTEFCLSILLKLCKSGERDEDDVRVEAAQLGAFQKILVLLQVGCGGAMKDKVTELLKLLNLYKDRVDCIDSSMHFKYLKKSF
ncbi:U-box domain-containing protein 21 isoform X1 [Momordica charantia]|uniref:U-box domain-containing protein n=2 Tax=Momordica charantia TaxID=3673 RepID=A0A6J1CPB4_MOMCH|nr:U-box domain-containing protein 21 isoform X1 [Momordica charantia]